MFAYLQKYNIRLFKCFIYRRYDKVLVDLRIFYIIVCFLLNTIKQEGSNDE